MPCQTDWSEITESSGSEIFTCCFPFLFETCSVPQSVGQSIGAFKCFSNYLHVWYLLKSVSSSGVSMDVYGCLWYVPPNSEGPALSSIVTSLMSSWSKQSRGGWVMFSVSSETRKSKMRPYMENWWKLWKLCFKGQGRTMPNHGEPTST